MRPLRFLLLLGLFVVLPVILTCVSFFSGHQSTSETANVGYHTRNGRLRALFSFSTPSSLFPPSAVISLTDDNSTSFLARPAAFGPSLPSSGLSGQLWVGKGFGEDGYFSEEALRLSGFELGCTDVPGWNDDHKKRPENGAVDGKSTKVLGEDSTKKAETQTKSKPSKRDARTKDDGEEVQSENDGTDDYLHHPLSDSNPASPGKPGEPASINTQDKSKLPVHADIESLQESADIAGKIVMLSRGGCGFLEKVKWAQRRGGIAVIVGDNEPAAPLTIMYAKGDTSNVTIPAIFTSFYSAHLLSSLVPPEEELELGGDGKPVPIADGRSKNREGTEHHRTPGFKQTGTMKNDNTDQNSDSKTEKGWVQNVLSVVGMDAGKHGQGEDSRRPPGSGNIDWVLLEDWDEGKPFTTSSNSQTLKAVKTMSTSTKVAKSHTTSIKRTGNDDFIIGVQDWRDTELIAPKSTATQASKKQKGKVDATAAQMSSSTSSVNPLATNLRGGSITPGSGEYGHPRDDVSGKAPQSKNDKSESSREHVESRESLGSKIASFFHREHPKEIVHPRPDERSSSRNQKLKNDNVDSKNLRRISDHPGLWVTLTPASPSTSPFFDTLLVLVVSPLVTLTFVYGLLLLRSRIRRRRWRAPKSIVERLPVRTYHTMSTTSLTTSSSVTSPQPSSHNSPTLGPITQTRVRPRSQTTTGVLSSSTSVEKPSVKSSSKPKRYTGRQVECVVCLEEYVDGESKVMSLPCGHEFHADCITPWLVTRRRTCPICKGDVVRSFSRYNGDMSGASDDVGDMDEQTSDDIQERAALTQQPDGSSAIPIPVSNETADDNDIEQGNNDSTPLLGATPRAQQGRWRNILGNSFGRLSGDTVWRSSVNDRTR